MKFNNEEIAFVVIFGGATRGGSGWGITPSGKIVKIDDNNPIEVISELSQIAVRSTDVRMRAEIEGVIGKAIAPMIQK